MVLVYFLVNNLKHDFFLSALQYHDVVRDLNEVANRRPRSTLILGSQEENARIRELQQENIELQTSVAEYQSALELIMAKYREQVRAIYNPEMGLSQRHI